MADSARTDTLNDVNKNTAEEERQGTAISEQPKDKFHEKKSISRGPPASSEPSQSSGGHRRQTGTKEFRPPTCDNPGNIQVRLKEIFQDGAAEYKKVENLDRIVRPKLIYYNTYQLRPHKSFSVNEVQRCIESTLSEILTGMKYNTEKAALLTGTVAEILRDRVLAYHYDRYKYVVCVSIGPMARQGVEIGFKCLWDTTRDTYAQSVFKSYDLFASACVYGIYLD